MIKWQGYEWISGERWGIMHPDKPECWYDESAIEIVGEDLHLKTHYNPKTIGDVESPFGVGLLHCTTKFTYGRFDIDIKLPKGPYLWPAFWMWCWESWPPEIDVFEAYSNKKSSYFNWNIDALWGNFYRVQTNIHLGKSPTNYSLGAQNHWLGWKSPNKEFHTYSVEWTENEIKLYYDNKLIRKIIDSEVLNQMKDKTMNVIINNGIQKEHVSLNDTTLMSTMVCKNFKYIPFK
jgi:beta-glucanase (GH16 family)